MDCEHSIKSKGLYFLNSLWLEEGYRNSVGWGYFETAEEAEDSLKRNWDNMHENWNNAAFIEFVPSGFAPHHSRRVGKRIWFKEKIDGEERILIPIPEPKFFAKLGIMSF